MADKAFGVPGSSPRVRGTLGLLGLIGEGCRFIPAGAGNARLHGRAWRRSTVHPRGCGERFWQNSDGNFPVGSSPRVRGTPGRQMLPYPAGRFIPAGAGNAGRISHAADAQPVHPRGCGERNPTENDSPPFAGSSPRVRGTLRSARGVAGVDRFIPAGAGNAHAGAHKVDGNPVHPRGCGERATERLQPVQFVGSSPRVRGTRRRPCLDFVPQRFIPAGAGNAICGHGGAWAMTVHPRGCGERSARRSTASSVFRRASLPP